MERYSKPTTVIPAPTEGASEDFDVVKLLDKAKETLRRDVTNLMIESSRGKLSPESSKSLVGYIKLLKELESDEKDTIKNMGDEQLKRLNEP